MSAADGIRRMAMTGLLCLFYLGVLLCPCSQMVHRRPDLYSVCTTVQLLRSEAERVPQEWRLSGSGRCDSATAGEGSVVEEELKPALKEAITGCWDRRHVL